MTPKELAYEKRGKALVKNLESRHFEAYYCATRAEALSKAMELIPEQASVGWGGAMSAEQIGLLDAVRCGNYVALDRDACSTPDEKAKIAKECMFADVFISGANAMSLDGQMVNIDGTGNRVAAIVYGPKIILVIVGIIVHAVAAYVVGEYGMLSITWLAILTGVMVLIELPLLYKLMTYKKKLIANMLNFESVHDVGR